MRCDRERGGIRIDQPPAGLIVGRWHLERLCRFLEKKNKQVTFTVRRLPRMATDQTVSLLPVHNQDPVPVVLEYLRSEES